MSACQPSKPTKHYDDRTVPFVCEFKQEEEEEEEEGRVLVPLHTIQNTVQFIYRMGKHIMEEAETNYPINIMVLITSMVLSLLLR